MIGQLIQKCHRPASAGRKLVIVGDAETIEGLAELVCGGDVLVIDATFLDCDAALARNYGHLTAGEAAALAAMCSEAVRPDSHFRPV